MTKQLSVASKFALANEVTPMGRRLFQLSRMRQNQRSYQLSDEFFAFVGSSRAVVDGELLARGLVLEKRHRDHTQSYALTAKGRVVAARIANHIGASP